MKFQLQGEIKKIINKERRKIFAFEYKHNDIVIFNKIYEEKDGILFDININKMNILNKKAVNKDSLLTPIKKTISTRIYPNLEKLYNVITTDNIDLINISLYKKNNYTVLVENKFDSNNVLKYSGGVSVNMAIAYIGKLIEYEVDILNNPIMIKDSFFIVSKKENTYIAIIYGKEDLKIFIYENNNNQISLLFQGQEYRKIIDNNIDLISSIGIIAQNFFKEIKEVNKKL